MIYSGYVLMRIFSSGCQKKGPEGKERRYPEAGESRGVAQTGCYVALRANIKHSKNSALCLFGELTLVLINRGGVWYLLSILDAVKGHRKKKW